MTGKKKAPDRTCGSCAGQYPARWRCHTVVTPDQSPTDLDRLRRAGRRSRLDAVRILHRALVQQPNDRDTLWALANYQLDSQNYREAQAIAQRLPALEPDDPDVRALAERAIHGRDLL